MKAHPLASLVATSLAVCALAADSGDMPDRVGLPVDYQNTYQVLRMANKPKPKLFATIYANASAAAITDPAKLPYPDGAILVMEWAEPLQDGNGVLRTGPDGLWLKGKVVRVDVMRREPGFGEAYGPGRAGQWEFASYRPDGTQLMSPAKTVSCAECHMQATAVRDYVFQGRFPPLKAE
jgi:hypothetical protein